MAKKNIKKYIATGLLATTLLTGAGLAIHDTNVDHTEGFCPISHIPILGIQHQGRAMVSDVIDKKGYNIAVYSLDANPENPLDIESVSVWYDYKPLYGLEDSINLLNNYQQHITLKRK